MSYRPKRGVSANILSGAVLSSLAIHHLDGAQKQELFADLLGMLAPAGYPFKAGPSEFAAKREQLALLAAKRDFFLSKPPRTGSLADLFLFNYTLWL